MVKDEKALREKMEPLIRGSGVFIEYMSSMNKAGIPDWYAVVGGAPTWVELKFAGLLPTSNTAGALGHTLTKLQRNFLRDNAAKGGFSRVCVGYVVDGELWIAMLRWDEFDDKGQISAGALRQARWQTRWTRDGGGPWFRDHLEEQRT